MWIGIKNQREKNIYLKQGLYLNKLNILKKIFYIFNFFTKIKSK
jgi:hypothetical protein